MSGVDGLKPWVCRCGAGLGVISADGNGVPQLLLYRHAVDLDAATPAEVDVIGPLTGKAVVSCDLCGEVRMWWPSAQALLALLDELNVEQLRQFADAFINKSKVEGRRSRD